MNASCNEITWTTNLVTRIDTVKNVPVFYCPACFAQGCRYRAIPYDPHNDCIQTRVETGSQPCRDNIFLQCAECFWKSIPRKWYQAYLQGYKRASIRPSPGYSALLLQHTRKGKLTDLEKAFYATLTNTIGRTMFALYMVVNFKLIGPRFIYFGTGPRRDTIDAEAIGRIRMVDPDVDLTNLPTQWNVDMIPPLAQQIEIMQSWVTFTQKRAEEAAKEIAAGIEGSPKDVVEEVITVVNKQVIDPSNIQSTSGTQGYSPADSNQPLKKARLDLADAGAQGDRIVTTASNVTPQLHTIDSLPTTDTTSTPTPKKSLSGQKGSKKLLRRRQNEENRAVQQQADKLMTSEIWKHYQPSRLSNLNQMRPIEQPEEDVIALSDDGSSQVHHQSKVKAGSDTVIDLVDTSTITADTAVSASQAVAQPPPTKPASIVTSTAITSTTAVVGSSTPSTVQYISSASEQTDVGQGSKGADAKPTQPFVRLVIAASNVNAPVTTSANVVDNVSEQTTVPDGGPDVEADPHGENIEEHVDQSPMDDISNESEEHNEFGLADDIDSVAACSDRSATAAELQAHSQGNSGKLTPVTASKPTIENVDPQIAKIQKNLQHQLKLARSKVTPSSVAEPAPPQGSSTPRVAYHRAAELEEQRRRHIQAWVDNTQNAMAPISQPVSSAHSVSSAVGEDHSGPMGNQQHQARLMEAQMRCVASVYERRHYPDVRQVPPYVPYYRPAMVAQPYRRSGLQAARSIADYSSASALSERDFFDYNESDPISIHAVPDIDLESTTTYDITRYWYQPVTDMISHFARITFEEGKSFDEFDVLPGASVLRSRTRILESTRYQPPRLRIFPMHNDFVNLIEQQWNLTTRKGFVKTRHRVIHWDHPQRGVPSSLEYYKEGGSYGILPLTYTDQFQQFSSTFKAVPAKISDNSLMLLESFTRQAFARVNALYITNQALTSLAPDLDGEAKSYVIDLVETSSRFIGDLARLVGQNLCFLVDARRRHALSLSTYTPDQQQALYRAAWATDKHLFSTTLLEAYNGPRP